MQRGAAMACSREMTKVPERGRVSDFDEVVLLLLGLVEKQRVEVDGED